MGFLESLKLKKNDQGSDTGVSSEVSTLAGSRPTSVADKSEQPHITLQSLSSHDGRTSGEHDKSAAVETQDVEEEDDESQYPTRLKLVLITLSLCLSVFCLALDNTIIATAIPKVRLEVGTITRAVSNITRRSPISSRPSTTWVGLAAVTFSQLAHSSCSPASCIPSTVSNGFT